MRHPIDVAFVDEHGGVLESARVLARGGCSSPHAFCVLSDRHRRCHGSGRRLRGAAVESSCQSLIACAREAEVSYQRPKEMLGLRRRKRHQVCPRLRQTLMADMDTRYGCLYDFSHEISSVPGLPQPPTRPSCGTMAGTTAFPAEFEWNEDDTLDMAECARYRAA